jgi:hypothetical protein
VDTKQQTSNPRSNLTIRNCLFQGWKQPGQVSNLAALNIKNHVQAQIVNCVFRDNEICLRLRGGEGEYGGALVTVERCAVYDSAVAVRIEDKIRDLKIRGLGIGDGVKSKLVSAGGGAGPGFENVGEFQLQRIKIPARILAEAVEPDDRLLALLPGNEKVKQVVRIVAIVAVAIWFLSLAAAFFGVAMPWGLPRYVR